MSRKSSVHGLFINATGWTGKASAITAGNAVIHEELARSDVRLMKGGLLAKRLHVPGDFRNPYPHGHRTSPQALRNTKLGLMEEIVDGLE